jgi:hypothetical protein
LDNGNRFKLRQERHISLLTELEVLLRLVGYKYFAPTGASAGAPSMPGSDWAVQEVKYTPLRRYGTNLLDYCGGMAYIVFL